jgi:hypothetical protein
MQIATIRFADFECGDEGIAVVRVAGEATGLALSLKRDGDVEVFPCPEQLNQLIEALQKARSMLPAPKPTI